jgi:hypothetical protein
MPFNNSSAAVIDGAPTVWYPVDHGFQTWSFDPLHIAAGTYTLASAGVLYGATVKSVGRVITNVCAYMTTAGGTLTSGQNFAAVYQGGNLVAQTGDMSTLWAGSTGLLTMPLAYPVTVAEGDLFVAFVANGTTKPTFATATGTSVAAIANAGLASPNLRFASGGTSITTTLPTTMPSQTALASLLWVALS